MNGKALVGYCNTNEVLNEQPVILKSFLKQTTSYCHSFKIMNQHQLLLDQLNYRRKIVACGAVGIKGQHFEADFWFSEEHEFIVAPLFVDFNVDQNNVVKFV
jgi:hypothetical protein